MEIPPVKIIGDTGISNEEASGVRSKINDKTTISCLRCDYKSDKLHNFRKHYRSMHLPCKPSKSLFCCDTSFLTKWEYIQHSIASHGKPKGCSSTRGVKAHKKTMVNCEPVRGQGNNYFCNGCEFTSSSKYNTLRHMKMCHLNKKVSCSRNENHEEIIPDSTTGIISELSASHPILHAMLQGPSLFQQGFPPPAYKLESALPSNQPVSSLEVSSSSNLGSARDSRNTGSTSSCVTLSSLLSDMHPTNPYSNSFQPHKWPFVNPSPYNMLPWHFGGLQPNQLFPAYPASWINGQSMSTTGKNRVPNQFVQKPFQETHLPNHVSNSSKNGLSVLYSKLDDDAGDIDIDVVT